MKKLKKLNELILIIFISNILSCVGTKISQNTKEIKYYSTSSGIYAIDFNLPGGRFFPANNLNTPKDFKLKPVPYYNETLTSGNYLYLPYNRGVVALKENKLTYYKLSSQPAIFKYGIYNGLLVGLSVLNETPISIQNKIQILMPAQNIRLSFEVNYPIQLIKNINGNLFILTYKNIYVIKLTSDGKYHEWILPIPFKTSNPISPVGINQKGNIVAFGWQNQNSIIFLNMYGEKITVSTTKIPHNSMHMTGCNGFLAVSTKNNDIYIINYNTNRYEKIINVPGTPVNLYCTFPTIFVSTALYTYAYYLTSGTQISGRYCYQNCKMVEGDKSIFFVGKRKILSYDNNGIFYSVTTNSNILSWTLLNNKLYYLTSTNTGYINTKGEENTINFNFQIQKVLTPIPQNLGVFLVITNKRNGSFAIIQPDLSIKRYYNLFNKKILGE